MRSGIYCGVVVMGLVMGASGCFDARPAITPNLDPHLRKQNSAQLAADAVKRHPYKAEAPRGGEAIARATVDYDVIGRLNVVNLSDEDWSDLEVWVNQKYVVYLPTMARKELKRINFEMLFDDAGNYFPHEAKKFPMSKVELYRGGKMYDVKLYAAD